MYRSGTSSSVVISSASLLSNDGVEGSDDETLIESKARRWAIALYESARLQGYTREAAEEQMEMITCLHKHECLGEVQDYDPIFRENFKAKGHPRCYTLVKALESGDQVTGVPHWRKITSLFIPCPNKEKKTEVATAKAEETQEPATAVTNTMTTTTTTSTTTTSVSTATTITVK